MPITKPLRWVLAGAMMALVGASTGTSAIAAPPPARPGLVIEAFDLFDTSADHRAFVVADQKRWLAEGAARMAQVIGADGKVTVIDSPASRRRIAAIAHDYQHPSTCRSCIIAAARQLGARYVFIGSVHKVSDLIIYMRGELDRIGDPRPLMVRSMEVKADNRTMILRAAGTMATAVEHHLG
ncbi:DUF2380 domain-containing protein [Acidiphilium acidophilum]|uniref:DUF2380 domain-containing protein n=1 Tax=Acidiphilium acidophilum TaxID=76588 RepID=UPI002E8E6610|nr:DUF2380 domain-containing protein [Acidiphilium acidophilum]